MGDVAWNQGHILMAQKSTGRWTVDVERQGDYRFSLRRWPEELDLPIDAGVGEEEEERIAPYVPGARCQTIHPVAARLKLFGREESMEVEPGALEATFRLNLVETDVTEFEAWFVDKDGAEQGAYYVYVERLS